MVTIAWFHAFRSKTQVSTAFLQSNFLFTSCFSLTLEDAQSFVYLHCSRTIPLFTDGVTLERATSMDKIQMSQLIFSPGPARQYTLDRCLTFLASGANMSLNFRLEMSVGRFDCGAITTQSFLVKPVPLIAILRNQAFCLVSLSARDRII